MSGEPEERQMPGKTPWWWDEERSGQESEARKGERFSFGQDLSFWAQWLREQSLSAIEFDPEEEEKSSAVHSTSVAENKEEKEEKAFRFQAHKAEWMSVLYWNGTFLILLKKQSSHKYNPCLLWVYHLKRIISIHLSLNLFSSSPFPSAFSSNSIKSLPIDTVISAAEKHLARQLVRKCVGDMQVWLKARRRGQRALSSFTRSESTPESIHLTSPPWSIGIKAFRDL